MTATDCTIKPFTYKLFCAGRRLGENPSTIVKDRVVHDCSGAYDYIDQCLQKHPKTKHSSIFAITDRDYKLKKLEEFASTSSIASFCVIPLPYLGEEKMVLKRKLPAGVTTPFWFYALSKIIPEQHLYDASNLAQKLLDSNYDIIICSDKHSNIRIVVSTLRGKGVKHRTDLLSVIGSNGEPCGSLR
jgi:hypothetical protein